MLVLVNGLARGLDVRGAVEGVHSWLRTELPEDSLRCGSEAALCTGPLDHGRPAWQLWSLRRLHPVTKLSTPKCQTLILYPAARYHLEPHPLPGPIISQPPLNPNPKP